MSSERKLILLPVDGSDQSLEVVRYVSKAVNLCDTEIVFLSIIDKSPDIFWETGRDSTVSKHLEHMKSWDAYKERKMRDCFEKVCKILETTGVQRAAVSCNVQKRKDGIARDILTECKFGYDAVAIARRGLGQMDESMIGSIAAKVYINAVHAPVCLLGGKPKAGRIMVGLDNSLSSVRVVNFVCNMLSASNPTVCLAHVLRIPQTRDGRPLDEENVKKLTLERETEMRPVFDSAVRCLTEAGFAPENISTKLIKASGSRAVNLFSEAKTGKFGTIVVGRKGINDVAEFTMGRIPYKLGQIAKNIALWLVP